MGHGRTAGHRVHVHGLGGARGHHGAMARIHARNGNGALARMAVQRAKRHRLGSSVGVRRRQMRRGRVGNITIRATARASPRSWVLSAGGSDDSSSTYFCHLWRRAHRYVAPAVEKTIMTGSVDTWALWRSQLPPDSPNFAVISVSSLLQPGTAAGVLAACGMAALQFQGGEHGAGVLADNLMAPLEFAARSTGACGCFGPSRNARLGAAVARINSDETLLPPGVMIYNVNIGAVDAVVVEVLCVDPMTGAHNPNWFGEAPAGLTAGELHAIRLIGQAGRGQQVHVVALSAAVGAAARDIDQLPMATLAADEPAENVAAGVGGVGGAAVVPDVGVGVGGGVGVGAHGMLPPMAFAVAVPAGTAPMSMMLVQPPSGATPFMVQVPPPLAADPTWTNQEEWDCPACTLTNEAHDFACDACGTVRPPAREFESRQVQTMMVHPPTAETGVPTTVLQPLLLDMAGDGKIDTVGLDTTQDGQLDTYYPAVLVDTNGDGQFDTVAFDHSGDGKQQFFPLPAGQRTSAGGGGDGDGGGEVKNRG